ncbi:MAG: enoyl-CoA hydratase/isomerase family protein [Alphaproteobacteria bacterium]|nr:enoyl-CoA hydratase/isomerase family protein [Alphaproteobacteria bacterium]
MTSALLTGTDPRGVATVTLNRPEVHNAFDDALIAELTAAFKKLEADGSVRIVILTGAGKSFSAGGDLGWMRRMADYSEAENLADARGLAALMRTLDRLAKPTIALVQGPAYAGACGLIACCDIAICVDSASFAVTETRIGLIPAVISPYLMAAIGERAARRYFLTAERFDAAEALRLGLVHQVVAAGDLAAAGDKIVAALLACGPNALKEAKALIRRVAHSPVDDVLIDDTATRIARVRATPEGKEGVSSFLEKRKPSWVKAG